MDALVKDDKFMEAKSRIMAYRINPEMTTNATHDSGTDIVI